MLLLSATDHHPLSVVLVVVISCDLARVGFVCATETDELHASDVRLKKKAGERINFDGVEVLGRVIWVFNL